MACKWLLSVVIVLLLAIVFEQARRIRVLTAFSSQCDAKEEAFEEKADFQEEKKPFVLPLVPLVPIEIRREIELPSRVWTFLLNFHVDHNIPNHYRYARLSHIRWEIDDRLGDVLKATKFDATCTDHHLVFHCLRGGHQPHDGPSVLLAERVAGRTEIEEVVMSGDRIVVHRGQYRNDRNIAINPGNDPKLRSDKRQFCATPDGFVFVVQLSRIGVFQLSKGLFIQSIDFASFSREVWDVKADRLGERLYALSYLEGSSSTPALVRIQRGATDPVFSLGEFKMFPHNVLNAPHLLAVFDSFVLVVDERTLVLFSNSLNYLASVHIGTKTQVWTVGVALPTRDENSTEIVLSLVPHNHYGLSVVAYDLAPFLSS